MATKFQKIRSVTLQQIKLEKNQTRVLYFIGPMYLGEKLPNSTMEAATLAHCADMETGEDGVVICPAVLQKELDKNYPGESYVGRGFEVTMTRNPERKYNHFAIDEVAIPDDFQRPTSIAAQIAASAAASAGGTAGAGSKARR